MGSQTVWIWIVITMACPTSTTNTRTIAVDTKMAASPRTSPLPIMAEGFFVPTRRPEDSAEQPSGLMSVIVHRPRRDQ
jgi:hypothetical protein